ncbi:MAG: YicC/YloC family endoribonuclease [Pseudomonadota bacterium]
MTGFARANASHDTLELVCELRTVNHRYLDVQFRLPEDLRGLETALKTRIGERLSRGKVDCTVLMRRQPGATAASALDHDALATLAETCDDVRHAIPGLSAPTTLDVLRWPGIVAETKVDPDSLGAAVMGLVDNAIDELDAMRGREGERLATMIRERLSAIEAIGTEVRERRPGIVAAATAKIEERIAKLSSDADPARLATEVAILAQKLDVDEELDRLGSHVTEIGAVLKRQEPIGRRLDFLMQELNREANTLASKSADGVTTNLAVELKVLIEQMREQIQNIE